MLQGHDKLLGGVDHGDAWNSGNKGRHNIREHHQADTKPGEVFELYSLPHHPNLTVEHCEMVCMSQLTKESYISLSLSFYFISIELLF